MPHYINFLRNVKLPILGKKEWLIRHAKAKEIPIPEQWEENLVCIEDNFILEIANVIVSQEELDTFKQNEIGYKQTWLIVPLANEMK